MPEIAQTVNPKVHVKMVKKLLRKTLGEAKTSGVARRAAQL